MIFVQVMFEAVVGTRTDGMIALDDIVSQDSTCTSEIFFSDIFAQFALTFIFIQ